MNKSLAIEQAIEIAKLAVQSAKFDNFVPSSENADDLADFISTLADRLEKLGT